MKSAAYYDYQNDNGGGDDDNRPAAARNFRVWAIPPFIGHCGDHLWKHAMRSLAPRLLNPALACTNTNANANKTARGSRPASQAYQHTKNREPVRTSRCVVVCMQAKPVKRGVSVARFLSLALGCHPSSQPSVKSPSQLNGQSAASEHS